MLTRQILGYQVFLGNRVLNSVTRQDFLIFMAIRLYHTLEHPTTPILECWSETQFEGTLKCPKNYRNIFKMSKNKFKFTNENFRIKDYDDVELQAVR
jgi:hypothetical protein